MSDIQPNSVVSVFNQTGEELAILEANSAQQLVPEIGEAYRLMMAGTEGPVLADHFVVIRSANDLVIRFTDNREVVFADYFETCVLPPAEGSAEGALQCSVEVATDGAEGVSIGSGPQANYQLAEGESTRIVYVHGSEEAIESIVESQADLAALYAAYLLTGAAPALAAAAFSPALLGVGAGALALAGGGGDSGAGTPAPTELTAEEVAQNALNRIKDYAEDNSKPVPTLDDYDNISVTSVNADNIAAINSAINAQGGGNGTPGDADDSEAVATKAQVQNIVNAYNAIFEVADGTANNADDPTQETYETIGITGIGHENELSLLGEVLDGKTKAEVDSTSKLQTLADAVQNVMRAAADTHGIPSKEELESLGINGVTPENLAAIQKAIRESENSGSEVASLENLQNQVNAVISEAALNKIADYADSSSNPEPTLEDYQTLSVDGVSANNLAAVNEIIDSVSKPEVGTKEEIQALINAAGVKLTAIEKIANYAHDKDNPEPVLADYQAAQVDGVSANNLASVNALVEAANREDADTEAEVEQLLSLHAVKLQAIQKIANYAHDSDNPKPTVADYEKAGVTGVDTSNLNAVNAKVEGEDRAGADTVREVQELANLGNTVADDALAKITAYAENSDSNPAPNVQDYIDAGVIGVNASNLDAVNVEVDGVEGVDADEVQEVQDIANLAITRVAEALAADALAKITAYASNSNNLKPNVQDYINAGINGVNSNNLHAVNVEVDAVTGAEADEKLEVQELANLGIGEADSAFAKIIAYAEDSTGKTAPSMEDYSIIGVTGVDDADKTALLGELVDNKVGLDVDTLLEVQTLANSLTGILAALVKIEAYNNGDGTDPAALTTQDYADAHITGVNNLNLDLVNSNVLSQSTGGADSISKVQALVEEAVAKLDLGGLEAGLGGYIIDNNVNSSGFGFSVSSAGDVNGDGIDDYILGAFYYGEEGALRTGASYVVFGQESGQVDPISVINSSDPDRKGFTIYGAQEDDKSGYDVSSAGDINGDGLGDLLVSAYATNSSNGHQAGAAYVVYGKEGNDHVYLADIEAGDSGAHGFAMYGKSRDDGETMIVSNAGDVNGDGLDDVIVGVSNANGQTGASYVVFGKTNQDAQQLSSLGSETGFGFAINGSSVSDYSGISVSHAGDVNGDGLDDLIIGAQYADLGGDQSGAVYVVYGKASGASVNLASIENNDLDVHGNSFGYMMNGEEAGANLGSHVSNAGDVNGDGIDDLIIGAYHAGTHGGAYVVFGKQGDSNTVDLSVVATDGQGSGGFFIKGAVIGKHAGQKVAGVGDINGDGLDDVAITSSMADANGVANAGKVYVVYGTTSEAMVDLKDVEQVSGQGFVVSGIHTNGYLGRAVSGAGDINGDGFDDLLVGYQSYYVEGVNYGASYVVYGGLNASAAIGTEMADTLAGDVTANQIVGGLGNDVLLGNGGADVLRGGSGDDVLAISDGNFAKLIGGRGIDTLRFDASFDLDFTNVADNRIQGIEAIDLNGQGNTIDLNLSDVLHMVGDEGSNDLRLLGEVGDTYNLSTTNFTNSSSTTSIDSVVYDIYLDASVDDSVRLLVEQDVSIVL